MQHHHQQQQHHQQLLQQQQQQALGGYHVGPLSVGGSQAQPISAHGDAADQAAAAAAAAAAAKNARPISPATIQCGISDEELVTLSVRDLNRALKMRGLTRDEIVTMKQR